jgi:DNA primase
MLDTRTEILDIAQKYLQNVRPSGAENIMSLCPFHEDNTPSFAMNVLNGVYFCHSCHAKGNLYTFLRGVGVSRAMMDLQYKELLTEARRAAPAAPSTSDPGVFSLSPLDESVLGHFDGYTLTSLLANGFEEQTIRHFDVGYDRWHGLITYPIYDVEGRLVAINGRTIYEGTRPRYKIYDREYTKWGLPARISWDKRKVLYNLHTIYSAQQAHNTPSQKHLVVVEGYKACMWVWQAGIRNVVALMGSYLSWEQRWLIEKFDGRVYFFLDNNDAGITGTYDACKTMRDHGSTIDAHVIEYPYRLADDDHAQPDNLTAEEIWEQFFDAVDAEAWLMKRTGTAPITTP